MISAERQIFDGHAVWEAARKLDIPEVPCVAVRHLSSSETRPLSIALNRLAGRGTWDLEALQIEFEELVSAGENLVIAGRCRNYWPS